MPNTTAKPAWLLAAEAAGKAPKLGSTAARSDLLSEAEIEALRRKAKETSADYRKVFAHLKPKR